MADIYMVTALDGVLTVQTGFARQHAQSDEAIVRGQRLQNQRPVVQAHAIAMEIEYGFAVLTQLGQWLPVASAAQLRIVSMEMIANCGIADVRLRCDGGGALGGRRSWCARRRRRQMGRIWRHRAVWFENKIGMEL